MQLLEKDESADMLQMVWPYSKYSGEDDLAPLPSRCFSDEVVSFLLRLEARNWVGHADHVGKKSCHAQKNSILKPKSRAEL